MVFIVQPKSETIIMGRDTPWYVFVTVSFGLYITHFGSPIACYDLQKPHRVRMAHNLIVNYGMYRDLEVFVRSWGVCLLHRRHYVGCYCVLENAATCSC